MRAIITCSKCCALPRNLTITCSKCCAGHEICRIGNHRSMMDSAAWTQKMLKKISNNVLCWLPKTGSKNDIESQIRHVSPQAITAMPAATLPESAFILALGTPALRTVPPQTGLLAQRASRGCGNETFVRNKPADQPSSKRWRRDAHCHRT